MSYQFNEPRDDDNDSTKAQPDSDDDRESISSVHEVIKPAVTTRPLNATNNNYAFVDLVDEDDENEATQPQTLLHPTTSEETTTLAPSPPPRHMISLNDNDDTVVWEDEFMFAVAKPGEEDRHLASSTRLWRGAEWTLLVIDDLRLNRFGAFLGIEEPTKLPPSWKMKTRFRFVLLDGEGNELQTGSQHNFDFKHCISSGRQDYGSFESFLIAHRIKCRMFLEGILYLQFKVRVILEHIHTPSNVSSSYNSKVNTDMVGLANLGATCYLNSLLQMLFHINRFRKAVYQLPHEQEEDLKSSTTLALQGLFHNLQTSNSEVSTKDLTLSFGWTTNEAFMQQDVQEMMRILLDRLEEKMKGTVVDGLIKDLFCGKVRSYIRCIHVNYESKREEDFYDIQLDVKGCKNIHESFKKYIEVENLDGENQYDAGSQYGKQDAKKGVIFSKFPPILTIHLKRFDFDFESMGFKKIHDFYEFPTSLNVDDYLVKEDGSQETAGSTKENNVVNDYILHSVLVHAGDVGGGHYYAYIQPGNEYNYQHVYAKSIDEAMMQFYDNPEEASDNGKWYKFNDELVHEVQQREAVNGCYGRRVSPYFKEVIPTMNSAYMLVYIRKSEARDIMQPIVRGDIPPSLEDRLALEQKKRKRIQAKNTHSKRYTHIYFAEEENIANFQKYSKSQYFIDMSQMRDLLIMVDSRRLGVLLSIAKMVQKYPIELKMWRMGNRVSEGNKGNTPLMIEEEIAGDELSRIFDEQFIYIQKCTMDCLSENDLNTFQDSFNNLLEKEKQWLSELQTGLKTYTEWYNIELEIDPCYGCGIGMSNKIMDDLKLYNEDLHDKLEKEMQMLTMQMTNLLEEYDLIKIQQEKNGERSTPTSESEEKNKEDEDDCLVFFKVFDPYNMLPPVLHRTSVESANADIDDKPMDVESKVESLEEGKGIYSILNSFTAEDAGIMSFNQISKQLPSSAAAATDAASVEFYTDKKPSEQYIPLKYLKYVQCKLSAGTRSVSSAAVRLLRRQLGQFANVHPMWLQGRVQLHYYDTPTKLIPLPQLNDSNSAATLNDILDKLGVVVVISLSPSMYDIQSLPELRRVPVHFESPDTWSKYYIYQRHFVIQPLEPHELRVLYNNFVQHKADEHPQNFNDNGLPLIRKKRNLENNSESTDNEIRIKSGLDMMISLSHSARDVVEMVARELQVNPRHLVLYLVPMFLDPVTQQPPSNVADPYETAKESEPITMEGFSYDYTPHPSPETLYSYFSKQKLLQNKWYNTYILFYRLLPHPVPVFPEPAADKDLESKEERDDVHERKEEGAVLKVQDMDRIVELLIGDEYLRQQRKLYLDHVFLEQSRLHPRSIMLQDVQEDIVHLVQQRNAKRRKVVSNDGLLQVSEVTVESVEDVENNYFREDEPCLVGVKFPLNPYLILELHRMIIKVSSSSRVADLLRHVRNSLNLDVHSSTGISNPEEEEILQRLYLGRRNNAIISDHIQSIATSEDTTRDVIPQTGLALHIVYNGIVIMTLPSDKSVQELYTSWCEPYFVHRYQRQMRHVLRSIPRSVIPYISNSYPNLKSMAVSVFNFTLLGNAVQSCEPTAFFPPFITYVREDDTYSTLLERLIEISGDKSLALCRICVVEKTFVPTFIPRTSGNGSLVRSHSTHISSTDSLPSSLESCSTPLANTANNTTFSDQEDTEETVSTDALLNRSYSAPATLAQASSPAFNNSNNNSPTVWSFFAEKYPHYCNTDWFTAAEYSRRSTPRNSIPFHYPLLGVQRATADLQQATQLKRSKRSLASTGIKINK